MSFRFIALFSCLVSTSTLIGADLQVREGFPPPFYSTIQSAIEDAEEGDNVLVFPGTYNEIINFLGKDITVRGIGPLASLHKIDGSGDGSQINGSLVVFDNGESSSARLENFTITNGSASEGSGCYIGNQSSATIQNCVFSNCSSSSGGAVYVDGTSEAAIFVDVQFVNNSAGMSGGAVDIYNSQVRLEGCSFENCWLDRRITAGTQIIGGGAISTYGSDSDSSLEIEGCSFSNCYVLGESENNSNNSSTATTYIQGGAVRAHGGNQS